jgi:ribonuclease E
VSSFRLICTAALTAAVAGFVAGPAVAQSVPAAQSSKPYLVGLRPPHEHQKVAHAKTSRVVAQQQPAATKIAQPAAKRRTVTATAKPHRPARLAEKINARVAWPSVEPPAAGESSAPATVLQFATDDAEQGPVAAPRPAAPAPVVAAARPSPPAKIVAAEERNTVESAAAEPPATAIVQTERFEAPASSQMRVILPAQTEAPVAASIAKDPQPARGSSMTVQMLVTLAGAISACVVAWLMIGLGLARPIRSTQT